MKPYQLSNLLNKIKLQLAYLLLLSLIFISLMSVSTYLYFANDLKSKESIMNRNNTGIVLLDIRNKPFFTFFNAKHTEAVALSEIPVKLQQAVISSEYQEFYSHPGFSIKAIIRSLFMDIEYGSTKYGGSTITQQLVKNALLNADKSFKRKFQEIILAQEIERRYTKSEILEMYLNSVYFGEGAFGIEEAAKVYFGKTPGQLTLTECAYLVGILPEPSNLSPFSVNSNKADIKKNIVLTQMRALGYISEKEEKAAKSKKVVFKKSKNDINSSASHFALMIRQELLKNYSEEEISRSGFRVYTTLDLDWQKFAEEIIEQKVSQLSESNVRNGAAVVIDARNGEVRVLVGSKDWFNEDFGKVNIATTPRSPGSAFKPIIYASAIEDGIITAATPLIDNLTVFPGNYKPQDYDRKWRGRVLARRALANSLNVPAVAVMQKVGIEQGLLQAKKFGITTLKDPSNYGLSLVLGTGEVKLIELTNAYAVFANSGVKNDITLIKSIVDKNGKIIFKSKKNEQQIISENTAFIISSILSDAKTRSEVFGNLLNTSIPAAVKTGTGEDYRNALTIGYTPYLSVGVWLGNNDNTPMGRIAGSIGPAPIWRELIEKYSHKYRKDEFPVPESIVRANICSYNGLIASKNYPSSAYTEYFIPGSQPNRICFIPRPKEIPKIADSSIDNTNFPEAEKKNDIKNRGRGGVDNLNYSSMQEKTKEQLDKEMEKTIQNIPITP